MKNKMEYSDAGLDSRRVQRRNRWAILYGTPSRTHTSLGRPLLIANHVGFTGFAAGCSPMIVFFALLGISCKRKIPEAHTLLEIIRIRYGKLASRTSRKCQLNQTRKRCPHCLDVSLPGQ